MDELGGFEPTDTTGFIQIESIRIKKYASPCRTSYALLTKLYAGGRKPTSARARVVSRRRMCTVLASEGCILQCKTCIRRPYHVL